jgi:predicted HTH domain antitoxin
MLKILPDDFKKQIKGLSMLPAIEEGNLLIIHLIRDQHMKFKKAAEMLIEHNKDIFSVHTEFNGKYHHVGGEVCIKDNINGYDFLITPMSPIKDKRQIALYRKLREICPKGKTRNAIIIGTHSGLIPLHVAHLYNRLYCVDTKKYSSVEARDNLRMNRTNNCLVLNDNIEKFIADFENYKYTPPGRKHKIGLFLADASMVSVAGIKKIIGIEPETVILLSEQGINPELEDELKKDGYLIKLELKVMSFEIHKIKKVTPDETVR